MKLFIQCCGENVVHEGKREGCQFYWSTNKDIVSSVYMSAFCVTAIISPLQPISSQLPKR